MENTTMTTRLMATSCGVGTHVQGATVSGSGKRFFGSAISGLVSTGHVRPIVATRPTTSSDVPRAFGRPPV